MQARPTWNDVNQYATSRFHFWSDGRYVRHAAEMMQTILPVAMVITRAARTSQKLIPLTPAQYSQFLMCVAIKLVEWMSRGRGACKRVHTPQRGD